LPLQPDEKASRDEVWKACAGESLKESGEAGVPQLSFLKKLIYSISN